jgi:hypothetical protein
MYKYITQDSFYEDSAFYNVTLTNTQPVGTEVDVTSVYHTSPTVPLSLSSPVVLDASAPSYSFSQLIRSPTSNVWDMLLGVTDAITSEVVFHRYSSRFERKLTQTFFDASVNAVGDLIKIPELSWGYVYSFPVIDDVSLVDSKYLRVSKSNVTDFDVIPTVLPGAFPDMRVVCSAINIPRIRFRYYGTPFTDTFDTSLLVVPSTKDNISTVIVQFVRKT